LLLATNTLEATNLAIVLDEQNKKRQEVEKKILQEAVCEITEKNMVSQNTIVLASPTWHPGVIGIVASKLAEKYLKPVVLLAIDGIEARGSGRIPQGLSLYTAVSRCQDLLLNYGGHELAAGLSIKKENIQEFAKAFETVITEMKTSEFVSIIDVDMELGIKDVTFELANDVARLAPFGQQNKMPVFRINRVKVTSVCTLKENKHLKLTVLADGPGGNFSIEALGFCMGQKRDEITVGDRIDLVCTLSVNAFMGNIKMQLIMQDFAKSIN
jgi:single-stranded-DNA-specific exonuclease